MITKNSHWLGSSSRFLKPPFNGVVSAESGRVQVRRDSGMTDAVEGFLNHWLVTNEKVNLS